MSETNLFFHAIQDALNAHIERMVEAKVKDILTNNKAYEIIMSNLNERIEKLETKVTALENNPAIGVDTTLEARVKALEERPAVQVDEAKMVEALNSQEWFWEKLHNTINDNVTSRVGEAMDDHTTSYDHDQYDEMYNEWGGETTDEFVRDNDLEGQIEERVNDVLRNASFSISI